MLGTFVVGRLASMLPTIVLVAAANPAAANRTVLISVNSAEQQADRGAFSCTPSGNGRYVAFSSYATNLTPDDGKDSGDIFRRDRVTGVTTLVSTTSKGSGNGDPKSPRISRNGRFVAFYTVLNNLVSPPVGGPNLFLHDLQAGAIRLANDR